MTEKHIFELNKWKLLIEDRVNSGMKVTDWCAANGYTKHAYYYWLSLLRKETLTDAVSHLPETINTNPAGAMVEIPVVPPTRSCSPVNESDTHLSAVIRKGDLNIELYPGMDPLLLKQLMETLIYA